MREQAAITHAYTTFEHRKQLCKNARRHIESDYQWNREGNLIRALLGDMEPTGK